MKPCHKFSRWLLIALTFFVTLVPPAFAENNANLESEALPAAPANDFGVMVANDAGKAGYLDATVEAVRQALAEQNGKVLLNCFTGLGSPCAEIEDALKKENLIPNSNVALTLAPLPLDTFSPNEVGNPPANPPPASPLSAPQPSDWKLGLSLFRIAGSGFSAWQGASKVTGGDPYTITTTVIIAASWAGLMQYNQAEVKQWLRTNSFWSRDFEKDPAAASRSFQKRLMNASAYAFLLQAGELTANFIHLLVDAQNQKARSEIADILTLGSLGEVCRGALASSATQVTWDYVNSYLLENAIKKNPEKRYLYRRLSGLFTLGQSMLMVYLNVLNKSPEMGWTAFWASVGIGSTGLAVQFAIDPGSRANLARLLGIEPKETSAGSENHTSPVPQIAPSGKSCSGLRALSQTEKKAR